jgi:hypothetical protein
VKLGLLALAAVTLPATLLAQYRGPRSSDYVFATDAWGARAVWVNPAGLATIHEASIMAEVLVERNADGDYPLAQYGFAFNSRGFGFGYRRDRFDDVSGNTWRLGFGRALPRVALGAALSVYGGEDRKEDFDIGVRWRLTPVVDIAFGAEHIGQPMVRDSSLRFTGTVGAGWSPLQGLVRVAADARATDLAAAGWLLAYRVGLRLATPGRRPIALHALLDVDDDFHVTRLVAGLAIGGDYQGILMGSGARRGGDPRLETVSLTAVASHRFP